MTDQPDGGVLDAVIAGVRRFIRRDVWLWEKRIDRNAVRLPGDVFAELHGRVEQMGLDHLMAPQGIGPDLPDQARARIAEEVSQHRAGASEPAYGLFDPDPPPQLYAAADQQRAVFLDPLLSREARVFRGVADPDLEHLPIDGVRARAVPRGDGWMLDGTKIFASGVDDETTFGIIYANNEGADGERDGVSAFAVECDRTGFQRWRRWPTVGDRPDTWELNLSALKLPPLNLIGDPGRAPAFANGLVLRRRAFSAAHLTGVASAAQDIARAQIWARREHGRPIAQGERAQLALADNEIAVLAARGLYLAAAAASDNDDDLLIPALAARSFAAEAAAAVVGRAIDLHGVAGASADLPLERWARDLQWRRLNEGGADLQRLAIAGRLAATFKK